MPCPAVVRKNRTKYDLHELEPQPPSHTANAMRSKKKHERVTDAVHHRHGRTEGTRTTSVPLRQSREMLCCHLTAKTNKKNDPVFATRCYDDS